MHPPYIGMTDVPDAAWLEATATLYLASGGRELSRDLHAGVMMSRKSLYGEPTKYAAVWPKNEEIAGIFIDHALVLNVLHYADYDDRTAPDDLRRAVLLGGPHLHAVQLDMVWPEQALLEPLREAHLRVILQVGSKAFERVDHDADALIERLKGYGELLDDVLLDQSGGKGIPLQAAHLEPLIYEIRARRPELGISVAGGLGPDTLHLVEPLIRKFPGLSIDAQGQLRPGGSSLDPFDRERAERYLLKAIELFQSAG